MSVKFNNFIELINWPVYLLSSFRSSLEVNQVIKHIYTSTIEGQFRLLPT